MATEVQLQHRAEQMAVWVVLHFLQEVQVQLEIMPVDLAVVDLENGVTTQAVAVVADIQAAREVITSAVVEVVVLTTMDLHKQILQVQTTQLDL